VALRKARAERRRPDVATRRRSDVGGVPEVGVRCSEEMIVLVLPQTEFEPLLTVLPDVRQMLNALGEVLSAKT
jgi:hypothetical protein